MVKRILIFSTDDFLHPAGGAEVAIGEIAKRNPDISFTLICGKLRKKSTKFEQVGNVAIHRMGFGIPKVDGLVLALFGHGCAIKLHKKNPFDIAWVVMASYGAFAASKFKNKTGVPYILTLQEGDSLQKIENKTKFVRSKFLSIFRNADGLQTISNFLYEWAIKNGFHSKCAKIIPNGVDIKAFAGDIYGDKIQKLRSSFGFPENSHVLITASRLETKNGVGDIIDSLKLLPENVCLVVCGGGALDSELKKQTKVLKLENRVKFLGFVERERLQVLFKSSDIFIRPSLTEGLGNAFLEAMASGIPVIGTPVGGIPDFLIDGQNGFFCQPHSAKSIADTVNKILSLSEDEKKRILSNALELVKEKYDWDHIGNDMRNMFECVYDNKGSEQK